MTELSHRTALLLKVRHCQQMSAKCEHDIHITITVFGCSENDTHLSIHCMDITATHRFSK